MLGGNHRRRSRQFWNHDRDGSGCGRCGGPAHRPSSQAQAQVKSLVLVRSLHRRDRGSPRFTFVLFPGSEGLAAQIDQRSLGMLTPLTLGLALWVAYGAVPGQSLARRPVAFHDCRNSFRTSGGSITCRSLRPFDCTIMSTCPRCLCEDQSVEHCVR